MEILIFSGSPRKGGNTDIMAETFAKGAEEAGNKVSIVHLSEKTVHPCRGCEYCFAHDGVCIQQDDMPGILEQMDRADLVVFASPIYYFAMSAQMMAVIDRFYARALKGYHVKKAVLLLDSGSPDVYTSAIAQYKDMTGYLKWEDLGIITISGMKRKGDMADNPHLKEVYALGLSIEG